MIYDFIEFLQKYFDQSLPASAGGSGANDWLKSFQRCFFNFVKIEKKYKMDENLSKYTISNYCKFSGVF